MKTGLGAHDNTENGFENAKNKKLDPVRSVPPKMSSGEQNKQTRLDALRTAQNGFGITKHENWARRPL
jgi:hypothetical protein